MASASAASRPVTSHAQRSGHQFLGSRRPALTREAPSRGSLLYTQALQLARLQDQEEAARTAFAACCKAHPDNTKVAHVSCRTMRMEWCSHLLAIRQVLFFSGMGFLGSVRKASKKEPAGQIPDLPTSSSRRSFHQPDKCCSHPGTLPASLSQQLAYAYALLLLMRIAIQAWGLMELQKGNTVAAVLLLERSVQFEPRNSPVLRWRPVQLAQQALLARRRKVHALSAQIKAQITL